MRFSGVQTLILLLCGMMLAGRADAEEPAEDPTTQEMDGFTMSGYAADGVKRWELEGTGAVLEGSVVTIHRPDGIGYDLSASKRTTYLTATLAQMEQDSRRIRMEHDVTIHTSDGLWLTSPLLYWLPDREELTTDQPVRLETERLLLRGRGATGHATLDQAVFFDDIELVLYEPAHHVRITCEGPFTFDYTRYIATFERNVHVHDGHTHLYADTLVAYLHKVHRTIRYAQATGQVRITQGPHTAHGHRAVYEPRHSRMTLLGAPSLMVYPDAPAHPALPPGRADAPARGVGELGIFGRSR